MLEICIANWWANNDESLLNAAVKFHGLEPNLKSITMVRLNVLFKIHKRSETARKTGTYTNS